MPLSKGEYVKALRSEYIVAEEATRLLAEIEGVLPDAMHMALCKLFAADKDGMPDEEFRKKARAAVLRELLEYLQTELNPPPRPGPRLVSAKDDMTEEILIKLLRLHFDHNKKGVGGREARPRTRPLLRQCLGRGFRCPRCSGMEGSRRGDRLRCR
jgi:hypothetical protein